MKSYKEIMRDMEVKTMELVELSRLAHEFEPSTRPLTNVVRTILNEVDNPLGPIEFKLEFTSFRTALTETLQEMKNHNADLCVAVYWFDNVNPSAMVAFMDLGSYAHMHEAMHDLYSRLSRRLGHPVSICHNHPTDEDVLILGSKVDSDLYDPRLCCKDSTIDSCLKFLACNSGYRPDIQAIARGAVAYADMCGKTTEEVLEGLDWNKDPQTQLLDLFTAAYTATRQ